MTPRLGAPAAPPSRFNLSAAALRFPQLTLFFVLLLAIAGTLAYQRLGQREDPDFTFRAMVVRTLWPGATTEQVDQAINHRGVHVDSASIEACIAVIENAHARYNA